jgi:Calx-beta domain-containing protein/polymorphic membrane protein
MNRPLSRAVRRLLGACLLFGVLAAPRAEAAGVVGTGTPASCTQAALNAALAGGGTVTFNCGAGAVIPITSTKTLTTTTTIDGTGQNITLDGGGTTRLFNTTYQFASFTLTFRGLTLSNGFAPDFGGAIRLAYQDFVTTLLIENVTFSTNVCSAAGNDVGGGALYAQGGIVTIRNSSFLGNRGGNGGAIGNLQARFTIEDTLFQGNTTNANVGGGGTGGAIYIDGSSNGQLILRRTTFRSNAASFMGGAIHTYMYAGASGMTIEDSLFENNVTDRNGGAIYHQNGGLTIARSTFTGNQTRGQGGALWLLEATPTTITNSTFTGNRANGIPPNNGSSGLGGAILINASTIATITHSTIANNHADWVGGAITGGMSGGSSTTLRGSLVANNTAANGGNPWNIGKNCSSQLNEGGGNIQFPAKHPTDPNDRNCTATITIADPLLLPLAANGGPTPTRAIPSNSLARDFVTSGCPPPSTDQRGVPRPANACDAGAYELSAVVGVGSPSVGEGTGGSQTASFPVSLSEASALPVTVAYATVPGTAAAGADYAPASGTLTIPAGGLGGTIPVAVVTDSIDEDDETFALVLSNPVNASIGVSTGTGTIVDDDAPPAVSAGDCTGAEGTGGGGTCPIALSLSNASGKTITVAYQTANGTATAPADYAASSGTVTFLPGFTGRTVPLALAGDAIDEADETFVVNLSSPANATLGDAQGAATIDDDDGPVLAASGPSVAEGDAGTANATFALSLSASSPQPVVVAYQTNDGTAISGSDYQPRTGTVTFPPGTTAQSVAVPVIGDVADERNEWFHLGLSSVTDASTSTPSVPAEIRDDDGAALVLREIGHGIAVRTRPGPAGEDLFVLEQPRFSSWEVVLDEGSGDLGTGVSGPTLERVSGDLATVVQSSVPAGAGMARRLRWRNESAGTRDDYVRVRATGCGTACGPDDVYRLRAYETTLRAPRYNCAGGQGSVLVLQNTGTAAVTGFVFLFGANGTHLASNGIAVPARGVQAISPCAFANAAGTSGSVVIAHDGGLELTGKVVSVDPGPGFAFDTPLGTRPR